MNIKYLWIAGIALVVLGFGVFAFNSMNKPQNTVMTPTSIPTDSPTPVQIEVSQEVSPTMPDTTNSPAPGEPGAHSGQGVISRAGVEEGGSAKLVFVSTIGTFLVNADTMIYDLDGKKTTFDYLKRGQLVDVKGEPGEGASIALSIRVLKFDQPVPTDVIAPR